MAISCSRRTRAPARSRGFTALEVEMSLFSQDAGWHGAGVR